MTTPTTPRAGQPATGATVSVLPRVFKYQSATFPDPNPTWSVERVREMLALQYPELASAVVEGPTVRDGKREFSFRRSLGTKS